MSVLGLSYTYLFHLSRGLVSCMFYIVCTVIHNFSSLSSLVFATDVELYKDVTNIVYNYDTSL